MRQYHTTHRLVTGQQLVLQKGCVPGEVEHASASATFPTLRCSSSFSSSSSSTSTSFSGSAEAADVPPGDGIDVHAEQVLLAALPDDA